MRVLDQFLSDLTVDARQADVKFAGQKETAALIVQIDLGVDRHFRWQLDMLLVGGELERAHVARGPCGPEKILRRGVRLRELDVQKSVATVSGAILAVRRMGIACEKNFGGHLRSPSPCAAFLYSAWLRVLNKLRVGRSLPHRFG